MQKIKAEFITSDEVRLAGAIELDGIVDAQTVNGVAVNNSSAAGLVLTGIDGANAQWAAGGGGGASLREARSGNNVNIGNGANAPLTFDTSFGPDVLLDKSAPAAPVVVAAGGVAPGFDAEE